MELSSKAGHHFLIFYKKIISTKSRNFRQHLIYRQGLLQNRPADIMSHIAKRFRALAPRSITVTLERQLQGA